MLDYTQEIHFCNPFLIPLITRKLKGAKQGKKIIRIANNVITNIILRQKISYETRTMLPKTSISQ